MSSLITYKKSDHTAIVTLNNEGRFNTLSTEMADALVALVNKANGDTDVKSIILTGEGKSFCVGGDMHNFFGPRVTGEIPWDEQDDRLGGLGWPDTVRLFRESKPIITAVNGMAVGGGVTLILPTDIIIAADIAQFDFMLAKLGAVPELGASHFLTARVGYTKATELLLLHESIDAQTAKDIGLISRVVPAEELLPTALAMADRIAECPPHAIKNIKMLLDANYAERDIDRIWKRESDALRETFVTEEFQDKIRSFLK